MSQLFFTNQEIILKLGVAALLGMIIGVERVFVHKEAGMKTHALVALGAATFIIVSELVARKYAIFGGFDPSRMASQIIVGIGFLGAGSIIFQGNRLSGLTTAGGLWVTASIGMASGFGFYNLAVITTLLVLMILVVVNGVEVPLRRMSNTPEKKD